MTELEIENLIKKAIEPHKDNLVFKETGEDEGLNVYWNSKNKMWDVSSDIDPLSALILLEIPEREKKSQLDDDEIVATLSTLLGRRPGWVRSFQCGWYGYNNKSTSINGYILGINLRKKYINK